MELKSCPDCGTPPKVKDRKTVHGLTSGVVIECLNPRCPGLSGVVNRYAYSEREWNEKHPRRPLRTHQ